MEDSSLPQWLRAPFLLNGIRVEPSNLRLSGPQGESTLEPKVMALLVALADRPGELRRRSELIDVLWPHGVGSDESLTRLVSVLRKTLSREQGINDVITTVPKLGYRFDAEIRDPDESSQTAAALSQTKSIPPAPDTPVEKRAPMERRTPVERRAPVRRARPGWTYGLGMAIVVTAVTAMLLLTSGTDNEESEVSDAKASDPVSAPPDRSGASLAVLPIESLTPDDTRSFLADGMMRDLTAQLSRTPNLRVAPYHSAREFTGGTADTAAAAEALDAQYIVTGSLLEHQGQVVLRIDLGDAELGQQVWSKQYSRPLEEFFALQDLVLEEIATSIFSELQAAEIEQIHTREEFDLSVYELIQKAEGEREVYSQAAAERILRTLRRALELDPGNPAVLSRLAIQLTQGLSSGFSDDPAGDMSLATHYLERARTVAPRDPRVLMGAGIASFMTGETRKAERLLEMSRATDPNEPHAAAILGLTKCYLGQSEAGLALIRDSEARAPRNPRYAVWAFYRGICHYIQNDWNAAFGAYRDAMDRNPNYTNPYVSYAIGECLLGREAEGRQIYQQALRLHPGFTVSEWMVSLDLTRLPDTPGTSVAALKRVARTCLDGVQPYGGR